jgi:dihydrofolate reductase
MRRAVSQNHVHTISGHGPGGRPANSDERSLRFTGIQLMSRRLRYGVAASLDGFIARPNGEYDWIVMDPGIDFAAMYKEFDTAVMGRKTYEVVTAQGDHGAMRGIDIIVFSHTLRPGTHPGVRIVNDDPRKVVAALKAKSGRDIWLFGGGVLFRTLLDAGLVDSVEVAVIPVLLGDGVPILPPGGDTKLVLADHRVLPISGIVALSYSVPGGVGPAPRIGYVKPPAAGTKKRPRRRTSSVKRTAKSRPRGATKKRSTK